MNLFLKTFVDTIQSLATHGLSITMNGIERHFKVGTLACLADTLAAHALGKVCHLPIVFAVHVWPLQNKYSLIIMNLALNYEMQRNTRDN